MNYRTDLAVELKEINANNLEGITTEEISNYRLKISKVDIKTLEASKRIGKPIGVYYTIDIPSLESGSKLENDEIEEIAKHINSFLPDTTSLVLVVGLGNDDITPDALGPRAVHKVLATRHVTDQYDSVPILQDLRAVATISPGVLGQTGMESSEIIYSLVGQVKPSAVIVIDALVSKDVSRLGTTIQISNTGISPGSGVMNKRQGINQELLNIPVVSIGIPTVVEATTLVYNMINRNVDNANQISNIRKEIEPFGSAMIVTPKAIDSIIQNAADIVGLAVNRSLQRDISIEDIISLCV